MPHGEQCLGVQIQVSMYFGLGGFSHNKHCALPTEARLLALARGTCVGSRLQRTSSWEGFGKGLDSCRPGQSISRKEGEGDPQNRKTGSDMAELLGRFYQAGAWKLSFPNMGAPRIQKRHFSQAVPVKSWENGSFQQVSLRAQGRSPVPNLVFDDILRFQESRKFVNL